MIGRLHPIYGFPRKHRPTSIKESTWSAVGSATCARSLPGECLPKNGFYDKTVLDGVWVSPPAQVGSSGDVMIQIGKILRSSRNKTSMLAILTEDYQMVALSALSVKAMRKPQVKPDISVGTGNPIGPPLPDRIPSRNSTHWSVAIRHKNNLRKSPPHDRRRNHLTGIHGLHPTGSPPPSPPSSHYGSVMDTEYNHPQVMVLRLTHVNDLGLHKRHAPATHTTRR
jgi:hypothetical protein